MTKTTREIEEKENFKTFQEIMWITITVFIILLIGILIGYFKLQSQIDVLPHKYCHNVTLFNVTGVPYIEPNVFVFNDLSGSYYWDYYKCDIGSATPDNKFCILPIEKEVCEIR